jgi:outer membrane autotransporter protein
MHSFALKKTAFAVLIALGAGVALAADDVTVGDGQSRTDREEATYGALTVEGTYINDDDNSVTADSVSSSGSFTNNGTFTAGSFEVSGGTFANSGTLTAGSLTFVGVDTSSLGGTVTAESATFKMNGLKSTVGENLVLNTQHLFITQASNQQAGLVFSQQSQIENVQEVTVTSNGNRTGLVVADGAELSFKTVNLVQPTATEDARVEVSANGSVTIDTLTVIGTKGMVQTNAGASATIHNIHVGEGTVFNLQTNGSGTADDKTGSFDISNVYVEKGGNFRISVYGSEPAANVSSSNLNITLASGAIADFGGWKEEGNTDWRPDAISLTADSVTVNVLDTSDLPTLYLSGADGKTNIGSLSVVADKSNNTGNAEADLQKLTDIVKTNVKGGADGSNQSSNVTSETAGIENITLTQEANDIFDGATATVNETGDGVVNIQSTGNDNIDGIVGTASTGFLLWRDEMTSLNRRLDDLRDSSAHSNGLWARAYNSRSDYSARNVTSKYTAIQVGYDRQIVDRFWLGGAFSYTDGEHELAAGSADNSLAAFTLYGTWMHENGLFVDVTGKYGRIDNEFDISIGGDLSEGDYDTNAWGLSVQAGWRWQPNQFFVEPQVELMYGRMSSVDYTTSTGMHVDHDAVDSLIGRAGVRLGVDYPDNRGRVYLRASVLHDWQGEAEYNFTKGGDFRHETDDLSGTWYEVGIGANFNVTDNLHFIGDLQTSQGGEVDTDYRINFVARYSF